MILGADLLRLLFAVDGLVILLIVAAIWIAATQSRAARRFLYVIAIVYGAASLLALPTFVGKALARGFHPFRASDVPPGSRVVIVVLGTGSVTVGDWWGDNYSIVDRAAAERVLEASHVYKITNAEYVISSGGEPHPSRRRAPSGDTMREALVALGVPPRKILVETESRTTRDEALVVKRMLGSLPAERVVLVTSESHMRRALGAFRAVGVECVPAITAEFDYGQNWVRELTPSLDGLRSSEAIAHEVAGIVYYTVRGWWAR